MTGAVTVCYPSGKIRPLTKWLVVLGVVLFAAPAFAFTQDTGAVIEVIIPTGDGANTAWTNNYNEVDDYPDKDDDASYISVTNSDVGTHLTETFTAYDMDQAGLVGIDSIAVMAYARKTGGATPDMDFCLVEDGNNNYADTASIDATSYTQYFGRWDDDPETSAEWTADSVDALEFGVARAGAPAFGQTLRSTQVQKWIYKRTRQAYDSTYSGTYVEDATIYETNPTYNYGGNDSLFVGYSSADAGVRRTLIFASPTLLSSFSNYYVDSAFLDLVSLTVEPGTHKIYAYQGIRPAVPGDSIGAVDDSGVCWRDAIYATDSVDKWQLAGCDSTLDDGGMDRYTDPVDSVTITATGTHTWEVTDWAQAAVSARSTLSNGTWCMIPIVLVQASEVAADSMVAFHAVESATAASRPRIRIYGTYKYLAGADPPIGATFNDSVALFGDNGSPTVVSTKGIRRDIDGTFDTLGYGSANDLTDQTYALGLWEDAKKNNNDWSSGDFIGVLIRFNDVYDTLHDLCLADDPGDDTLIEDAVIRVYQASINPPRFGTIYAQIKGPVLQGYPVTNELEVWTSGESVSAKYVDSSTVSWGTMSALKHSAGVMGDTSSEYEYRSSGTATNDLSDSTEAWITDTVPVVLGYWDIDVTEMLKIGVRARGRDTGKAVGTSILDTLGFAVRVSYTNAVIRDSFSVDQANAQLAFYGAGMNVPEYAPVLRIGYNITPSGRCGVEGGEVAGSQVIIIGAVEPEAPPRYHRTELREP